MARYLIHTGSWIVSPAARHPEYGVAIEPDATRVPAFNLPVDNQAFSTRRDFSDPNLMLPSFGCTIDQDPSANEGGVDRLRVGIRPWSEGCDDKDGIYTDSCHCHAYRLEVIHVRNLPMHRRNRLQLHDDFALAPCQFRKPVPYVGLGEVFARDIDKGAVVPRL